MKLIKWLGEYLDHPTTRKFKINMARIEKDLKPWLYVKADPVARWLGKWCKWDTMDILF